MPHAFDQLARDEVSSAFGLYRGKVRDVVDLGSRLLLVASDRISAFDRPLGVLPGKGEILTQLSQFWFEKTRSMVENHTLQALGPRAVVVQKAQVLPVEVIVRGYLTGSAWRAYSVGKPVPGLDLPAGMRAHQRLEIPAVTPTTKAAVGEHDEPISREQIVASGLVSGSLWSQVEDKALALFEVAQHHLAQRGLILVDTKYEFGLVEGRLVVVDEIHTPDCSRFWFAYDYERAFHEGREPAKLDKEYLRAWLVEQGFTGEGPIPTIPQPVFDETLNRYVDAYERITGLSWVFSEQSAEAQRLQISSFVQKESLR